MDVFRKEEIDLSDIPEMTSEMVDGAIAGKGLRPVPPKKRFTLPRYADVVDWFKAQARGYRAGINLLLRAYMEAQPRR